MPVTAADLHELAEIARLAKQQASPEEARFCPICGGRLHADGKRLLCDRHGMMRVYIVFP